VLRPSHARTLARTLASRHANSAFRSSASRAYASTRARCGRCAFLARARAHASSDANVAFRGSIRAERGRDVARPRARDQGAKGAVAQDTPNPTFEIGRGARHLVAARSLYGRGGSRLIELRLVAIALPEVQMLIAVFVIWLVCGFIASSIASSRGANSCVGFICGFIFGPLGIVIALLMNGAPVAVAGVGIGAAHSLPPGIGRECPYCRTQIPAAASVCRFCQRESAVGLPPPALCRNGLNHSWEKSRKFPGFFGCRRCMAYTEQGLG